MWWFCFVGLVFTEGAERAAGGLRKCRRRNQLASSHLRRGVLITWSPPAPLPIPRWACWSHGVRRRLFPPWKGRVCHVVSVGASSHLRRGVLVTWSPSAPLSIPGRGVLVTWSPSAPLSIPGGTCSSSGFHPRLFPSQGRGVLITWCPTAHLLIPREGACSSRGPMSVPLPVPGGTC